MMKKWCLLFFSTISMAVAASEPLTSEAFLERTRTPASAASYAMLDGILQHRTDGGKLEEFPIYLGVLINRSRTQAELLIDNREGYLIDRISSRDGRAATSVTELEKTDPAASIAKRFHLNPGDLATGFLFYNFVREEAADRVKGIACRVLVLEAPDKSETAKVYIARDYFFPLRAEFFKSSETAGEPERTLETASFKKENDLYYAELLNLFGPNWRTRVQFTKAKVGLIDPQAAVPQIFRKAKK